MNVSGEIVTQNQDPNGRAYLISARKGYVLSWYYIAQQLYTLTFDKYEMQAYGGTGNVVIWDGSQVQGVDPPSIMPQAANTLDVFALSSISNKGLSSPTGLQVLYQPLPNELKPGKNDGDVYRFFP